MTIYVYADSATKNISTVTAQQLVGDSRVEVQLADGHAIGFDSKKNWKLTSDDTDVELDLRKPKIFNLVNDFLKGKHLHDINYRTELTQSLFAKRTMVQGEIQLVEWYADEALTDLILRIDIVYNRDSSGFALDRATARIWINEDGSDNTDIKLTTKRYDINLYEQLCEGQRRRCNLANTVALTVLNRMQVVLLGTYTPAVILQKGRDFLLIHSIARAEFVSSSHQQILTDVAAADAVHDEWLDLEIVDSSGVSIRDHIITEFTLY